jgi:hypothetical protein
MIRPAGLSAWPLGRFPRRPAGSASISAANTPDPIARAAGAQVAAGAVCTEAPAAETRELVPLPADAKLPAPLPAPTRKPAGRRLFRIAFVLVALTAGAGGGFWAIAAWTRSASKGRKAPAPACAAARRSARECPGRIQSVDAQVKQLRAAGAGRVYRDTASGAKTERVQLRRVLNLRIPATYS